MLCFVLTDMLCAKRFINLAYFKSFRVVLNRLWSRDNLVLLWRHGSSVSLSQESIEAILQLMETLLMETHVPWLCGSSRICSAYDFSCCLFNLVKFYPVRAWIFNTRFKSNLSGFLGPFLGISHCSRNLPCQGECLSPQITIFYLYHLLYDCFSAC